MKNFFMTMALVAMVATSCSNDDASLATISGPQKSVKVSLENVITTRVKDEMIPNSSKVVLNECQVFFVGGDGMLYTGKDVNGGNTVTHYFTTAPLQSEDYHFLPPAVQKVVVVGNYGSEISAASLNDIKTLVAKAEQQQDDENLLVYGEAELVPITTEDKHGNSYKADVSVKPLVARIEVGGFACDFSDTPLYDEVKITMLALNNYYEEMTIGGTLSKLNSTSIVSSNVYPFFNSTDAKAYTKDEISVTLTPDAPSAGFDDGKYLVYHTFAGSVPQLVVRITGVKDGAESPLYLATNSFTSNGAKVNAFEAGSIYRMKFNGEDRFAFDEEDLNQPEKCVDVAVEAAQWVVVNVTPEF